MAKERSFEPQRVDMTIFTCGVPIRCRIRQPEEGRGARVALQRLLNGQASTRLMGRDNTFRHRTCQDFQRGDKNIEPACCLWPRSHRNPMLPPRLSGKLRHMGVPPGVLDKAVFSAVLD